MMIKKLIKVYTYTFVRSYDQEDIAPYRTLTTVKPLSDEEVEMERINGEIALPVVEHLKVYEMDPTDFMRYGTDITDRLGI